MYEVAVESGFCAAHAVTIGGSREETHGHNWKVTVVVAGEELDADGLLCDFHDVQGRLAAILEPLRNVDLNRTPPFDRLNPTAEHVARHVAASLAPALPPGVAVARVCVEEAPGCTATCLPGVSGDELHRGGPRRAAEGDGE